MTVTGALADAPPAPLTAAVAVNTSAAPCPRGDTGVISAAAASTAAPIVLLETVIIHLSCALLRGALISNPRTADCDHHWRPSIAVLCRMQAVGAHGIRGVLRHSGGVVDAVDLPSVRAGAVGGEVLAGAGSAPDVRMARVRTTEAKAIPRNSGEAPKGRRTAVDTP